MFKQKNKEKFNDLSELVISNFEKIYIFISKEKIKKRASVFVKESFIDHVDYYIDDSRFIYCFKIEQRDYQEFISVNIFLPAILTKFSNKTKSTIRFFNSYDYNKNRIGEFLFRNPNDVLTSRFKEVYPLHDLKSSELSYQMFNNEAVSKITDEEIGRGVQVVISEILIGLV